MIFQIVFNTLASASAYALVALGFTAIYGAAKFFHLAHGLVFSLGAYLFLTFSPQLPGWAVVPAVLAGSLFLVLLSDVFVYRWLRLRGSTSTSLLLASLGILTVGQNLLSVLFGDAMRRLPGTDSLQTLHILGAAIGKPQAYLIAAGLAASAGTYALMEHTPFGRLYRAISSDPELARCFGINLDRFFLLLLAWASTHAAIAGVLVAMDTGLVPAMGFRALLMAIVAAIVGGIGNPLGAIWGALLVSASQNVALIFLPSEWQDVIAYTLLLIFLTRRSSTQFAAS